MHQTRIDSLKRQHHEIEAKIDELQKLPKPDQAALAHLKREKLRLKDELASFA